jgi:hypothetical protein
MSFDTYGHLFKDIDFQRQQVNLLQATFQNSVRNPLEKPLQNAEKGLAVSANPLISLVGDLGLEPRAFGSGDQRSIHLS